MSFRNVLSNVLFEDYTLGLVMKIKLRRTKQIECYFSVSAVAVSSSLLPGITKMNTSRHNSSKKG